jgi:integrase
MLADVRRGFWSPAPRETVEEPQEEQTFHEFADWWLHSLLRGRGRPLLATLAGTGLRIEEALSVRWYDVDVARGTLSVRESKTDAGVREIRLLPALREELALYRSQAPFTEPDDYVFPNVKGGKDDRNNVRQRLILPARREGERQASQPRHRAHRGDQPPQPPPHERDATGAGRRAKEDRAKEMGHVSSRFTFDVYEQAADLHDWPTGYERAEFDRAVEWAD